MLKRRHTNKTTKTSHTVTLTWHTNKFYVHELHRRYIVSHSPPKPLHQLQAKQIKSSLVSIVRVCFVCCLKRVFSLSIFACLHCLIKISILFKLVCVLNTNSQLCIVSDLSLSLFPPPNPPSPPPPHHTRVKGPTSLGFGTHKNAFFLLLFFCCIYFICWLIAHTQKLKNRSEYHSPGLRYFFLSLELCNTSLKNAGPN